MVALRLIMANWKLVLVAVLLAALGLQTLRVSELKREAADQRATDAESQRMAIKAQRDEFELRQGVMNQEATRAQTQLAAVQLDLTAVRGTAAGLQRAAELAANAARRRAQLGTATAPVDGGDPIGVLALVLGRAGARSEIVERLADERGIRTAGCERAFNGLQPAVR